MIRYIGGFRIAYCPAYLTDTSDGEICFEFKYIKKIIVYCPHTDS